MISKIKDSRLKMFENDAALRSFGFSKENLDLGSAAKFINLVLAMKYERKNCL